MGESARINADKHRTWITSRVDDLAKVYNAQADLLASTVKDQRAMQTNLDALKTDCEWLRAEVIELRTLRENIQIRLGQDYVRRKTLEDSLWARLRWVLTGKVDVNNNAALYR